MHGSRNHSARHRKSGWRSPLYLIPSEESKYGWSSHCQLLCPCTPVGHTEALRPHPKSCRTNVNRYSRRRHLWLSVCFVATIGLDSETHVTLSRQYLPLSIAKGLARKSWEVTTNSEMSDFLGWVMASLRSRGQRVRGRHFVPFLLRFPLSL